MKDTLDWRRYFPLKVGNQWQYRSDEFGFVYFTRWHIRKDTVINGTSYYVIDITGYDSQYQPLNQLQRSDLIRYDTTNALIAERTVNEDGSPIDVWWLDVPCGLDAPFNARYQCTDSTTGQDYAVDGSYDANFAIGADTVSTAVLKMFDSLGGSHTLAADIGLVARVVEGGSQVTELVFVHIDSTIYGQAVVPTKSERAPEHPSRLVIMSVYPNPFDSEATVVYYLPDPGSVTLSVYDILGRRELVHTEYCASRGRYRTVIDGAGLRAGTYVIRLAPSSGQHGTRLITLIH